MRIWFRRAFPWLPARSRVPDLVCQQVVELVTDYLEGALSAADRQRFEAHLAGCPHCTEYLAQMRQLLRLAGRLTPEDLTPDMRSDLTDLYRQWRAEGGAGQVLDQPDQLSAWMTITGPTGRVDRYCS